MGWVFVLAGIAASIILYSLEHYLLLGIAAVATVGTFWSYGVMHNYAIEAASRRPGFRGGFSDIEPDEADAVPDRLATVNLVFSVATLILLGVAIVMAVL